MPRRTDLPPLRRESLDPDPIAQFNAWFDAAAAEAPLHEAMSLATVDADGAPDARMVLLKGTDADGFRFHTNYESAKARQLEADPRAALIIYWREMDRQVRVRGAATRLDPSESDAYFATRSRARRIGAWASAQSSPLTDRGELQERIAATEERFEGVEDIRRPEHWGGYILCPDSIELWQGVPERLHDRFLYSRAPDQGWELTRLSP